MAKLVVSWSGAVKGHYFLDKEKFTIGRMEDSDIFLDDPSVSKLHALIYTVGNDQILEDNNSANGISINGEKVISRQILQNNDVMQIGSFQVKYINQRASSNMDFDKTLILESGPWCMSDAGEATQARTGPQVSKTISAARSVKLNFPLGGIKSLKGESSGQEFIISRPLKTFGRPGVQRAMISRGPQGYHLTHVEGSQTARLNGKTIGAQSELLKDNDIIEVAHQQLMFFIKK